MRAREACYPALEAIDRTLAKGSKEPPETPSSDDVVDVEAGPATITTVAALNTTSNGHNTVDISTQATVDRCKIPLPRYVIDSSSDLGLRPDVVMGHIVLDKVYFSYPTRRGTYALIKMSR